MSGPYQFPERRPRVVRRLTTALAVGLAAVLAASLTGQVPALAARKPAYQKLKPQMDRSVAGSDAVAQKRGGDQNAAAALKGPLPTPAWPAAGTVVVDLSPVDDPRPRERGAVRAGPLPVLVDRAAGTTAANAAAALPTALRVSVLDRAAADRARQPVLLRLGRADGSGVSGRVRVSVDYYGFRTAYGADWSNRLRLVVLPECALTAPDQPGCQGVPLPSTNSARGQTISADVDLPAAQTGATSRAEQADVTTLSGTTLLALTSGPSGSTGSFAATSLAPSSTWSAGGSSGDFSWAYHMRVPPSVGGPAPDIRLEYSSQAVDGRTATSNNQPSVIGEGFEWSPGYIERRYKGCADDMKSTGANNTTKTGDLCWATDNATFSLNGKGGELIRDDATGAWHPKSDDGSRVEHLTDASNGDNDGEYWKITTTDGTQYYFGLNRITGWVTGRPETNSTWRVPVYGNNPGEPCHTTAFSSSWCQQAYRWGLDYVVDRHGNTMSVWYDSETNNYARNLTSSTVSNYIRSGYVSHIDYGTRTDSEFGNPPMRVTFGTADRCTPNSICDFAHPTSWPDTPADQNCSSSTSCTNYSPTFWTQKRLTTVTTQLWGGSGYRDVERWSLNHAFLDPGDSTRAGLWLSSISHTGLVGGTLTEPDVKFTGVQLANRVDTVTDQQPAMNWFRMSYVDTESGERIGVTYLPQECVAGSNMPASPESNTKRCFPVKWTPEGRTSPILDYFHKYVVSQVTETDMTGGSPRVITTYGYPNPPAWHYTDDDGLIPAEQKTWSVWRGYDKVTTTKGDPGEQTYTESRFFRGMNGDHLPNGARSVTVDGIADNDAYAGMVRETVTYNGPGGAEIGGTVTDPWSSAATSTRNLAGVSTYARYVGSAAIRHRMDRDGGRPPLVTESVTTFDQYGMPIRAWDKGDVAVPDDDKCVLTTYARNTSAFLMATASRVEAYALPCGGSPAGESDVLSDIRTSYDGQAYGAAPTKGDATQVDVIKQWSTAGSTYVTVSRSQYDANGRATDNWDVRGNHSSMAYTPATGGPLTKTGSTNPMGWTLTTELEPAWGEATAEVDVNGKRTDVAYDPLGRTAAVWVPGRVKGVHSANRTYSYQIRPDGVSSVTTSALNAAGNYITSYQLFDSLLRPRQTQAPAVGGGRALTDTFYNTAGQAVKTNGQYYNADAGPGTTLFNPLDNQVPAQHVAVYDGTGRVTADVFKSNGLEKWRTTTFYGGDRNDVTPPAGGTPTSTVADANGRTVELRQYHGSAIGGAYDSTSYRYNRKGRLLAVTDAAGNQWTWTYDLLGRATRTTDPDKGALATTYNDAGDVLTTTDARNVTLAYTYDTLGRSTGIYEGSTAGPKRAEWTYDTLANGQLTSSTRWINNNAYVVAVRGYTDLYQPTGSTVTIPASEGLLAGSYSFSSTYNVDGSVSTTRLPAGGGLLAETLTNGYEATSGLPTTLKTNYGGVSGSYVTDTQYTRFGEQSVVTYSTGGLLAQAGTYYEEGTRRLAEAITARETAPSTVADTFYTYLPSGLVTKIADKPAGRTPDVQCFGYDYLGRMSQAWTPTSGDCAAAPAGDSLGGAAPYWQSWTFDVTGNRSTQTDHATPAGDAATTYTYQGTGAAHAHALASTSTVDSAGTRTASYSYDGAGNTTSRPGARGQQTLTWDPEGHLATLTDGTGTHSYVYDASGNRLIARNTTGATLYLGTTELRLTTATNQVSATRYYSAGGQVCAMRTAAGVTWLTGDNHGTALVAVDAGTQQVTRRYELPYGSPRGTNPSWPNPHGFVGGISDPTGLTHLGAREYDPDAGRFISVDPLFDANSPQEMNGYAYGVNSPATMADPAGERAWYQCPDGDCETNRPLTGSPGSTGSGSTGGSTTTTTSGGHNYSCPGGCHPPAPPAPKPVKKHCGWSLSCYAKKSWNWAQNHATVVGFVAGFAAGALCGAAIGWTGVGAIACGAVAGAVGSLVTDLVDKKDHSFGDIVKDVAVGAVVGAVGGAIGRGVAVLGGKLASTALGRGAGNMLRAGRGLLRRGGGGAEGGGGGEGAAAGRTAPGRSCHSFDPDTPVLMADRTTKAIKDVKVGDQVETTDPVTGKDSARRVELLHDNHDADLADVTVRTGTGATVTIHTTWHHPFWDATARLWTEAAHLPTGTRLRTLDGSTETVVAVRTWLGGHDMRDLTVAEVHTYYIVTAGTPILVHNCGPEDYVGKHRSPERAADSNYVGWHRKWHDNVRTHRRPNFLDRGRMIGAQSYEGVEQGEKLGNIVSPMLGGWMTRPPWVEPVLKGAVYVVTVARRIIDRPK